MVKVTRGEIVAAARDLLRERGYAGTSMGDVAVVVGLRKASLYTHFRSKEELAAAALDLTMLELRAAPNTSDSWLLDYDKTVDHVAEYLVTGRQCIGVHLVYGGLDGETHSEVTKFFENAISVFSSILERGFPANQARELAEDTLSVLEGATVWLALRHDSAPMRRAVTSIKERVANLSRLSTV